MKKKILGGIAVLAIAAVAVMNVNLSSKSNDLSDVSLANIEALASGERENSVTCKGNGNLECPLGGSNYAEVTYKSTN
jgi:hypothetical protein